jgi:hypothetical protein
MTAPCRCGQHQIDPPAAFFGEGGSVHGPKFCTDSLGHTIPGVVTARKRYQVEMQGGWTMEVQAANAAEAMAKADRSQRLADHPDRAVRTFESMAEVTRAYSRVGICGG